MSQEKSWEWMEGDRVKIYINNILWMFVFFAQHSGMCRITFKTAICPLHERLERAFYVFTAAMAYHLALRGQCPLPPVLWEVENNALRLAVGWLNGFGLMFIGYSTCLIDHWFIFGFT